jgi:hypothetical protein
MKNHLFWITLPFFVVHLNAQNPALNPPATDTSIFHVGFLAGLNVSNISFPSPFRYNYYNVTPIAGVRFGLEFAWSLSEKYDLRTGIEIQSNGNSFSWLDRFGGGTITVRPVYLEFPVIFEYTDKWFFAGGGPNIGFGVGGNIRENITAANTNAPYSISDMTRSITWTTSAYGNDFNMLDLGFRVKGGAQLNKIRIGASVGYGILTSYGDGSHNY